jgi:hypothetical protein
MDHTRIANGFACAAFLSLEVAGCPPSRGVSDRVVAEVAMLPSVQPAPILVDTSLPNMPSAPSAELPRGGREIFPRYRLVGFCGTRGGAALGRLTGNLRQGARDIAAYADLYAQDRTTLPVFELIAVVATTDPGLDGQYRRRVPDFVVDEYLREARAARALLLLNIQPGRSDFMSEAAHFEKYLRQPDVGLALDPEWAMKTKKRPGKEFGQMTGSTVNAVAEYLADIVRENRLPEKALVFHQVNPWVLAGESDIQAHDGIVLIKSVDGLGQKASKIKTYNLLVKNMPAAVHPGFKLFFEEDVADGHNLMKPESVLALTPKPEYVMYE